MNQAHVGIIGLGVMGANLARNFADKKVMTAVYNRTTEITTEFIQNHGNEYLTGLHTLEEFLQSLALPRKIILMVKAGDAIDQVLKSLVPLLSPNDIVLDFGNSHYHDTKRRQQELEKNQIDYWGCGISGGEEGALHGPSLMPGGKKENWPHVQDILEKIAAKDFQEKPCVTYLGPQGSGHYVKMVHNGIEYAILQLLAESYEFLKTMTQLPAELIGKQFHQYHEGKLNSYLMELATKVLQTKDPETKNALIDQIQDQAEQKGTGTWTAIDALERGVAIPTIIEAVESRVISSQKNLRKTLHQNYSTKLALENIDVDKFIDLLDDALFFGYIMSYIQGLELIQVTSTSEGWNINLAEVTRIWQGGCIIRSTLLKTLTTALEEPNATKKHLLELAPIEQLIKANLESLRQIVLTATKNHLPLPAFSSVLNHFTALSQERGNTNLIQGLRDAFGAHTYERLDQPGHFHTEWNT